MTQQNKGKYGKGIIRVTGEGLIIKELRRRIL